MDEFLYIIFSMSAIITLLKKANKNNYYINQITWHGCGKDHYPLTDNYQIINNIPINCKPLYGMATHSNFQNKTRYKERYSMFTDQTS